MSDPLLVSRRDFGKLSLASVSLICGARAFAQPSDGVDPIISIDPRYGSAAGGGRWESSENWSGAYVVPRNGNRFVEVSGQFRVPNFPPNMKRDQSVSFWIGFDGQRDYWNSSLPQVGLTMHRAGHAPTYRAWWQWWANVPESGVRLPRTRGRDKRSGQHPNFISKDRVDLMAGDTVLCKLQVRGPSKVTARITCYRQGSLLVDWSKAIVPPRSTNPPVVSGATAEWIVERPRLPGTQNLLRLLDFGELTFTDCVAISAPAIGAAPAEYQSLSGARYINMFELTDTVPQAPRWLSRPQIATPPSRNSFSVNSTLA